MAREIWRQQRHDPTHLSVHRPLYISKRLSVELWTSDLMSASSAPCSLLLCLSLLEVAWLVVAGPAPGFSGGKMSQSLSNKYRDVRCGL